MPFPSSSLATQRPDLAASFQEFDLAADRQGFIGLQILPISDVDRQAGNFGRIPIEQLLQNRETERTSGGGYSRGNWTFTTETYATTERGAEEPVDDRDAQLYSEYFTAELFARDRALDAVLRAQERRIAAAIFDAARWTGGSYFANVTNEWDDWTNATPIVDVEAAVLRHYAASAMWPNAMVINRKVFRNLRNCAQIIDRIESSGAGNAAKASDVTADMLAKVFDIEKVLVAGASKNSAKQGQAASLGQIWSDEYCWIGRVATTSDFKEPCVGRTFHWGADGSQAGGTVESYREEQNRADIIRVRHEVQEKILYTEMGQLLGNITT